MLTKFISQWNPFNLYGREVELEDLICNPLQPTETLREDCLGHCRRIKAPSIQSSSWEKIVFWLQTNLNEKGHLEAIDKMVSLFHEKLLQHPPQETEELQEFNFQADRLRSLANDYCFVFLKMGNPSCVEFRLEELKQQAYSIFSYYQEFKSLEEELERKNAFIIFQREAEQELDDLGSAYAMGLLKARHLLVASCPVLHSLFEERVQSLRSRLRAVQELQKKIDQMEMLHKGKFTIPAIEDHLNRLRSRLCGEVRKIAVETEIVIGNLIMNYRIAPFKDDVKMLLDSFQIDPDDIRANLMKITSFHEGLDDEIFRIQDIFKSIFD